MAAANATIAALKVSLGLDSARFTTGLRDASATMQRESRKQAQAVEQLASRVDRLRSSLSPVYAEQKRLTGLMKEAQALYRAGAISGAEYGRSMGDLTTRLKAASAGMVALASVQRDAAQSAKVLQNAGLGLSRQFADVGVSLAGGINPMMVLIQQGPQIADAFAVAKGQGAGFNTVVKELAGSVGGFLKTWGGIIAIGGAVAGVFLLWQKHLADTKAAMEATAKATQGLAEVQNTTRDALASAADFAEKYGVANAGLTKTLDDLLIAQNSAYKETLAGIDANDQAGRAAVRRAELERLLTVSILKRAAAEAEARAKESDAAAEKAASPARRYGAIVGFGLAGDPLVLQAAQEAEAAEFRKRGGETAKKAAAEERAYAKSLNETADALLKMKLTLPETAERKREAASASRAAAKATNEHAKAEEEFDRALKAALQTVETANERQLREMHEVMLTLREGLERGKISIEQFREAIERLFPVVVSVKDAQKAWNPQIEKSITATTKFGGKVETLEEQLRSLADTFGRVEYSINDMFRSLKSGDFGSFLLNIQDLLGGLKSLSGQGAAGLASIGSIVANTIGGSGGRAIGGGLGIAAGGLGLGAFAASGAGAAALGTLGLGAGAISGIAALAGPIGLAAGALYAAVKLFNIGGKPTNAGAGYDLRTGAISGNKRTAETEQAATGAGEAIKGFQEAVKAAGIDLKTVVNGLVIGTRDASQIYLSTGQTLTSAVGDAAAAVDTAARAILADAVYASEQQKKVVEGLVAAGKTVEDIIAALQVYEGAQQIGKQLADQILQLTDPKAYDIKAVKADIEAQRKAYAQLATEGYLTAEQLAGINAQLSTLEGLRLDEVLKRYAEAVVDTTPVDNTKDTLAAAAESAKSSLLDAYNAFADAKRAEIQALRDAAEGLKAFRRELSFGDLAGRDPLAQLDSLRREFQRLAALPATDPERLANLQSVSQAFLQASRAASPNALAYNRDLAAVRRAVEASQAGATSQADTLQAQLDAQTAMLTQLGLISTSTQDMASALKAYLGALENAKAGGVANDNFNVAAYLGANPDLARNWNAGGSLRGVGGSLEEAAFAHWILKGRDEVAAGQRTRGFATGGQFRVGGSGGIDSQLMQFWASPGEMVSVSHGDPQSAMADGFRQLDARLATVEAGIVRIAGYSRRQDQTLRKWDGDGLPTERVV
ncbi:phage tail length tape measure family protein [Phenylobacterium kunshanense]|uniref:Bacteriophage tail tape measure N-terminal domain-containing protein n=1 Tax=Phenylobacterium kunshanense TaxID=1445034 RepID=A0A328BP58_9CAUL|nr:phage tail length tape measure family protein [Phenylobacterium kunshanense]RAK68883.1 hypothetical protein DJ019_02390 [Phenylobacterium kunshanense]